MATAAISAPAARQKSGFLSAKFEELGQRYRKWRMYRQTVNELSALSDHELADIGLNRSMIRSVALHELAREKF